MALTADTVRAYTTTEMESHPVAASTLIYEGAAVGDNGSGYARGLNAGDVFLGFAAFKVDNSAGSAGDLRVEVMRKPVELPVTSAALGDEGKPVYAQDDGTFGLVKGSNSHIGYISRFVSAGVAIVVPEFGRQLLVSDLETP